MGLLDKLKGVKGPKEGVAPVGRDELASKLLGLNADQVPFTISQGAGGEEGDLIAEWKIVDAQCYEIFAKAGLEKAHRILLSLDASSNEARALEQSSEVSWEAGVPTLRLSVEKFQGRTMGTKEFGKAYAFTGVNPLSFGEVYNYRFDVSEMKDPIISIVISNGWSFVPVLSKGKLS